MLNLKQKNIKSELPKGKVMIEIQLVPAAPEELHSFCTRMQDAFAVAVIENFGAMDEEKIPSAEDVRQSFAASDCMVYQVVHEKRQVGGVILKIDRETHRNSLELFFISPDQHGKGLGLATWRAVEQMYPETLIWETATPYFEKRNIHFYVNKCDFKIVKFFNKYYHAPDEKQSPPEDDRPDFDFFVFEKDMRS